MAKGPVFVTGIMATAADAMAIWKPPNLSSKTAI
jgi:hypothetical protein